MRKILVAITITLALLISVVLTRTLRFPSKQMEGDLIPAVAVDKNQVIEHLAQALRFQTVSHQDTAQSHDEAFIALHAYLEQAFPKVHAMLTKEVAGEYSLLFCWNGSKQDLKPILLMSHLDVVPVEPGTESSWTHPPFEGRIADGYLWGRGAIDDKAGVLGILESVEMLIGEGFHPRRTIYLAFGHDEEIGGQRGAMQIAALLQSGGVEPEYVLDEGGAIVEGIIPGLSAPIALIGIAEKGYVSLELTVESEGGHSSMPPPQTAVGILSAAIHRLENNQMPARMSGATRQLFEYVGPEMSFPMKSVFANLWLFGPLVKRQLTASPTTNATIRTTTAATMFEGSIKENVLPIKARAVVNFRILPGDSIGSVIEHVRQTINDPRVKIRLLAGFGSEPSVESDVNAPSFQMLQRTIRQVFPDVVVAPNLVLGATDSRHYAGLSRNLYRFLPIWISAVDLRRAHGTDERISVENYAQIVSFYRQLILNSDR
jgi:carboxypeptidase PM20D1